MKRLGAVLGVMAALAVATAPRASAQGCSKAVIFTLPGTTWEDVARVAPPALLNVVDEGASGSIAVRTVSSRTTYASGFATIGAGTRLDGGKTTGGQVPGKTTSEGLFEEGAEPTGLDEIEELADDAGYDAQPGALATALEEAGGSYVVAIGNSDPGIDVEVPRGPERWALLAAMDRNGEVRLAATSEVLLETVEGYPFGVRTSPETAAAAIESALAIDGCAVIVIDPGDLTRADEFATTQDDTAEAQRDRALLAADGLLATVVDGLSARDLLIVASPTSPAWDEETHLGVAAVRGPGFDSGAALVSASTRADGFVTLPDIAPTVLEHFDIDLPAAMLGRPFATAAGPDDPVAAAVEADREAVYSHGIQADLITGFVIGQVAIYVLIVMLLRRSRRGSKRLSDRPMLRRCLELGALAVVAFPVASYLATPLPVHQLKLAGFVPVLLLMDAALVAVVSFIVAEPLFRLMALASATVVVMIVDLALGGHLQLTAVFGNDPINAGRFAGLGNSAFAALGTCAILAATLLLHGWRDRKWVMPAAVGLFAIVVVADGAPQLGSDVGGVLALVPALAITLMLLIGRRPSWRTVAISAVAALAVLALFLAIDLARPPESQTHLSRFVTDIRTRGAEVLLDTVERKARTNLRIFTSTIWTYLVPPALAAIAYLLLRPRGSWRRLAEGYPGLRAGLIGSLILGVLGFLVNDSGIVVPAMVLSFLVPMALLMHLAMERDERAR